MTDSSPVLVTGATGRQGGAVARALLAAGIPVRALVRDPGSERAKAVEALGATLVPGDLGDKDSLVPAATGARAVFSVQTPDITDLYGDAERVRGRNLVDAARAAEVPHFVHTSVAGTGRHQNAPDGEPDRWTGHYWASKVHTEKLVRTAGFPYWTLLRPAFFMENFVRPSYLFANFVDDRLLTVIAPATEIALVAVRDIGTAATAAVQDPERFNGLELDLAGDVLPFAEIVDMLSGSLGARLEYPVLTADEALAQGLLPEFVSSQRQMNTDELQAEPGQAHSWGISTTLFKDWLAAQ